MKSKPLRAATLVLIGLAVQTLSAADLSGKWIFSFHTPDGIVDGMLELTQDGEKLTAKFDSSNLEGAASDEEFTLKGEYFAQAAGYASTLSIKGKPDGEGLSGAATWDVHDLSFTAKRAE
jgi:hypothetical protein